jgi:hypothetical protein
MIRAICLVGAGLLMTVLTAGCYYSPKTRAAKADPSFMSEAEVEVLVQRKLERYGIKFIPNMKLRRDEVMFVADGYDRDIRVGYEYRSHEGLDFQGESGQSENGLTDAEIEYLKNRQKVFREFFLIIPEGNREKVESAVDDFVKDLYTWEVLKKAKKKKKKDSLFPEDDKKKDMLPWEATGDLKKKRKEMETKEELDKKPEGDIGGDDWEPGSGETDKKDDDEWGGGSGKEKKEEKIEEKKEEKKEEKNDDLGGEWGEDDEEDF